MANIRICDILTEYIIEFNFRKVFKEAEDEVVYGETWRDRME